VTPTEYIDVLSDTGEPTGIMKSREDVHARGDVHRTIHVWMVHSVLGILLQKRSPLKENHPGLWDLSCAGHISAGETSLEAAVKELREELGIAVTPEDLHYLFSHRHDAVLNGGSYIDREIHDIYLVIKDIPLSSFTPQPSEVESLRYIDPESFEILVRRKDPQLVPHFEEFSRVIAHLKSIPPLP
jgi:isopentenyldiphosphate isomerase